MGVLTTKCTKAIVRVSNNNRVDWLTILLMAWIDGRHFSYFPFFTSLLVIQAPKEEIMYYFSTWNMMQLIFHRQSKLCINVQHIYIKFMKYIEYIVCIIQLTLSFSTHCMISIAKERGLTTCHKLHTPIYIP